MKKVLLLCLFAYSVSALAGFGVQAGAISSNKGLDDNDNGLLIGANLKFKLLFFAVKIEGFYADSSGRYANQLGSSFGEADIDIEAMFAADIMFYPVGGLFFVQFGVNHISLDVKNIDFDAVDNELGLEAGLGVTVFDKLMVQGKILYTPNALKEDAVNTLEGLDENIFGYMVTVGWQF